jgi:anti-sigma-K factor RskA
MDYSRPKLVDRLAAEYVLGTLRGPARRRLESLLPAHPALREAVSGWQLRLARLSSSEPGVEPSAKTWQRIEQRLFGAPAKPLPWWRRLAVWQGLSGLALAGMVGLAVLLVQPRPAEPPLVIVLQAQPQAAAALNAAFVASVSGDGRALVLRPLAALPLEAGRALELWSVPAQGAPRSLGLVRADGATTVLRERLLQDAAALAVSLEPAGGSPTGAPTGPIVSLGAI